LCGGIDPVPVIVDLGTWDPATSSLPGWLAQRIVRTYPRLGEVGPDGSTMATALVAAGRILPVLDGFDELAPQLRHRALAQLNATAVPLLLAQPAGRVRGGGHPERRPHRGGGNRAGRARRG